MPRSGKGGGENRGGPRQLPPGKASATRTDLNAAPRSAGTMKVPGQTYGDQAAQVRRQQAVPMGPAARPPALTEPSQRPQEPLTAGLPSGPGPGPEALGMSKASPDMMRLREYLPALAAVAATPGATAEFRNHYRRLRAAAPEA